MVAFRDSPSLGAESRWEPPILGMGKRGIREGTEKRTPLAWGWGHCSCPGHLAQPTPRAL